MVIGMAEIPFCTCFFSLFDNNAAFMVAEMCEVCSFGTIIGCLGESAVSHHPGSRMQMGALSSGCYRHTGA